MKLFSADKFMKRLLVILTLFISFCASAQMEKIISSRPNPPKLVNDYTNTLTGHKARMLCPGGPGPDWGADRYWFVRVTSSCSGSRGARIHTSCAVVVAPTLDRALAR